MIRLGEINADNYKECLALSVADNQKEFVSSNLESLAKAYIYRDIITTFAIYQDELMIGFMMLRFNESYDNYFLWQFMIDRRYQGKGYGKQVLKLLIGRLKEERRCQNLTTTYKVGNEQSKYLYESVGFSFLNHCEEAHEIDLILNIS